MTEKNDALIVGPKKSQRLFSLVPSSFGEAKEIATMIANSEFAPKDYKGKPESVLIAIQMGADVGLSPMQSLQNIAVVNGRPSIWGDAALALCMPALERFVEAFEGEQGTDAFTAVCTAKRKGWADETIRRFSVADARKAGLWGKSGTWSTYPHRMLQHRARGFALRDCAADLLMGLVLAEEAMDYPDAIEGTVVASEIVSDPRDRIPEGFRENLNRAFSALNLAPGLLIAKLNEYMGREEGTPDEKAQALLEWCKDEYAKRKTGQPRAAADNSKKRSADGQGQPQAQDAGVQGNAADVVTVPAGDVRGGSAAIPTDAPQGSTQAGPLTAAEIPFAGTAVKVGF